MNKIPLLVLAGPTASGKTSLAIEIAKSFDCEIISADSMQIYKEFNIGTAKPTKEEQKKIVHYLIDKISIYDTYSSADYKSDAVNAINAINSNGKIPLIVGGTGLYINSVINDYNFIEFENDYNYRDYLLEISKSDNGIDIIFDMLSQVDEESTHIINKNNVKRVIRALEIYHNTGKKFSQLEKNASDNNKYDLCYMCLNFRDRQKLYDRINKRVDCMINNGLMDEAFDIYTKRDKISKTSSQAIGYKELFDYFDNLISKDEAVEKIKQETRRYAKRQLTWFRRDQRVNWIYADDFESSEDLLNNCKKIIEKSNIL